MNTNDLKLFEAVVLHGSFTKAAEAMFTVQSNVTARIKSLEEEFGAPLLFRTSRKVSLTPAGETLMGYSKQIHFLIDEAKQAVRQRDAVRGQIRIGFLETTMAIEGPRFVNELAVSFPLVDLEFKSAMRDHLIKDVLQYRLDAAFVPAPINRPELEQVFVKDEEIVAVAPSDSKSLEGLLENSPLKAIVFDQGCVFRGRLEAWLVNSGVSQYHKTEMNSIEGVLNFIEAGIGFGFLPRNVITSFYSRRKIKTYALPKELGLMTTVLVFRKDIPKSPALEAFISLLKSSNRNG